MKTKEFDKILTNRLAQIKQILGSKAEEYAQDNDRLHNFKVAATMNQTTPAIALWGMATKHLVSVTDLINGKLSPSNEMIDEKVGDMINYLILLEAVLKEQV